MNSRPEIHQAREQAFAAISRRFIPLAIASGRGSRR
jgi:hypothetical protein